MKNGDVLEGYHLAQNAKAVIVAPNVYDRTVGLVSVVPRDDIEHAGISQELIAAKALGSEIPTSLIGRGAAEAHLTAGSREGREAVLAYLAALRVDPGWRYPPRTPWATAEDLMTRFDEFDDSVHPFVADSPRTSLNDLLVDPQLYVARTVLTTGRVLRATSDEPTQQLILGADVTDSEAFCNVTIADGARRFRAGDRVEVRAVVTAWGTWISRPGEDVKELALTCSAGRLVGSRVPRAHAPERRRRGTVG